MPSKTIGLEVSNHRGERYEAAVVECLAKVDRILKRIRHKDAEIEKSQRRTRTMLAELAAPM